MKDINYKTVERLYSDPIVIMILNNLFMNSLKRKGVDSVHASGDGTGYSLTVTKQVCKYLACFSSHIVIPFGYL